MVWKTVKWWAFFLATWDRIEESRLKLQSYLCVRNKSLSKPSFSSSHYHQCALRANKVIPWISRFRSRQYILGSFGLLPPPPPPPTSTIARWLPAPLHPPQRVRRVRRLAGGFSGSQVPSTTTNEPSWLVGGFPGSHVPSITTNGRLTLTLGSSSPPPPPTSLLWLPAPLSLLSRRLTLKRRFQIGKEVKGISDPLAFR